MIVPFNSRLQSAWPDSGKKVNKFYKRVATAFFLKRCHFQNCHQSHQMFGLLLLENLMLIYVKNSQSHSCLTNALTTDEIKYIRYRPTRWQLNSLSNGPKECPFSPVWPDWTIFVVVWTSFKACGNGYLVQIAHSIGLFFKKVSFYSESIFGHLFIDIGRLLTQAFWSPWCSPLSIPTFYYECLPSWSFSFGKKCIEFLNLHVPYFTRLTVCLYFLLFLYIFVFRRHLLEAFP